MSLEKLLSDLIQKQR